MQIDFHLGATYVVARMAGFNSDEANIIASSAQYVDDAVKEGTIYFTNRSAFSFIASAHRMLDYRNFRELANHTVWMPFHFLPGNEILPNSKISDPFLNKIICRPNSVVAQRMLQNCIENYKKEFGLFLTGITSHVYIDTWAHQGFMGISHPYNKVTDIFQADGSLDIEMLAYRKKYFKRNLIRRTWDKIKSWFVGEANPVGHGAVLSYPDLPYLQWAYKDWNDQLVHRNNPKDFLDALEHLYDFYINLRKSYNLQIPNKNQSDWEKIKRLIVSLTSEEELERLESWRQTVAAGNFSFGTDVWSYIPEGEHSWLDEAFPFQTADEFKFEKVEFKQAFVKSKWKYLHDALLFHRYSIIHEILPEYEIIVS